MLESFLELEKIREKPYLVFVWSIIISSIAVMLARQLSYVVRVSNVSMNLNGIFIVLFTIVPSVYFVTQMIKSEEEIEEKELVKKYEKRIWERHSTDITILLFFFFGLVISFSVWSFFMPGDFMIQIEKLCQHQTGLEACGSYGFTGHATQTQTLLFSKYLVNNLQVMVFAFIFSLLFGAGAVFIITWNASVLGVAISQNSMFLWEIGPKTIPYLPHGLFEIGGYLVAGLAGGILSAAIIRGHHRRSVFKRVTLDSILLLIISIVLILVGAGIEAYL